VIRAGEVDEHVRVETLGVGDYMTAPLQELASYTSAGTRTVTHDGPNDIGSWRSLLNVHVTDDGAVLGR
jgi:hypothetical protein